MLKNLCDTCDRDPATFLNYYLPLRMHPKTREAIELTIKRYKPDSAEYYYGVIISEKTVLAVIKKNPKITIVPTGKIFF
jgi:hypothetical protein